jgi:phage replication O-like protein O
MKPGESEACDECPASKRDEWRVRGALIRMELRRHDLKHREMMIAELILDKTYGWHRDEIMITHLRHFTDLTGISESDVVKMIKSLHARRVIRVRTKNGQPHYSMNADSEAWKAMPRTDRDTIQRTLNVIRESNGMPRLNAEEDATLNFKNRPAAKKITADLGKKHMGAETGDQDEFPNLY